MHGYGGVEKTFLLVDDHTLIRCGLAAILRQAYTNALIHESADGKDIIERLAYNKYDLIIIDIQMPDGGSLQHIKYIHINYPHTPVLVYSMATENIYAPKVLHAGAKGFISKESPVTEVETAIDMALNGKTYLSPEFAEIISGQPFIQSASPFAILSPRELQIVSLLLAGHTLTDISKTLHLQNSTVGTHKARIFKKLKINNLLALKDMSDIYL
jgi:two-component system, NarL family, invasion response regulator UvrY